jgi:hypothetical protein
MEVIAFLNFSRSSALSIASFFAPAELVEHALAREVERAVERGLPSHGGQQRVRPLLLDDARHHLPRDRLDVGDVRHLGVRHDRGGVGVHQHDAVTLASQRLARLRAGVIELARLADDDRAGADDEDRFEVGSLGHPVASALKLSTRSTRCEGVLWEWNPSLVSARAAKLLNPAYSAFHAFGFRLSMRPTNLSNR